MSRSREHSCADDGNDIIYVKGRHSGIPECCIEFFLGVYAAEYDMFVPAYLDGRKWDGSYVPCPQCLSVNRPIRLHVCDRRCRDLVRRGLLSKHEVGP